MKTVVITGGAGFIGSHLCDAYLKDGWKVLALDDLSTGSLGNLDQARRSPNFEFIKGNITSDTIVAKAVPRSDLIVHLAARIGLKLVIESPLKTLETNVKGTEVVLQHAAMRKTPTLVASTSEVYGMSTKFPAHEDDPVTYGSPTVGRWSYACSKAYDESLAMAHHRENGLPVVVVRLFNTVGPRQSSHYGMVVPRLVRQAMLGESLTVYGDGSQTRGFGHVFDVVEGMMRLAAEDRAIGQVFNLGNPQEISIADLAGKIILATKSKSRIDYVPFDKAYAPGFEEIMRRVPDISKARATVGFEPSRSVDDIIADVIADHARHEALPRQ